MIIQHLANLPSSCPSDSSSLESCISALKSSISALESFLKTTEGASGHWETFGWLCAIAVGVGIAGEIVVIVSEHFEGLEDWERGIIRPPDRPPAWRFWFDIVATLIVLGGVFGEAGATAAVASINSQLRSKTSELRAKSDQLVAVTTEEAGDAAASAKAAREELRTIRGEVGTAQDDIRAVATETRGLQSNLDKASAQEKITDDKLNEAGHFLWKLHQSTVRLAVRLGIRTLDPDEVAARLKDKPKGEVFIWYEGPINGEPYLYSKDIGDALTAAGWHVDVLRPFTQEFLSKPPWSLAQKDRGVVLMSRRMAIDPNERSATRAIQDVLIFGKDFGGIANGDLYSGLREDEFFIGVFKLPNVCCGNTETKQK